MRKKESVRTREPANFILSNIPSREEWQIPLTQLFTERFCHVIGSPSANPQSSHRMAQDKEDTWHIDKR